MKIREKKRPTDGRTDEKHRDGRTERRRMQYAVCLKLTITMFTDGQIGTNSWMSE